jgi:hypothetical protein
MTIAICDM